MDSEDLLAFRGMRINRLERMKFKNIGLSVPEKPMDVHILGVLRQSSVFIDYI